MRFTRRLAAAATLAAAVLTGLVATAGPATALSPCAGDAPPDWCFAPPAVPAAPTNLQATAVLQTTVSLSWTNNAGSQATYHVVRTANGVTNDFLSAAGSTAYSDQTAPAGSTVDYLVYATACNLNGCTDSSAATLRVWTHTLPASPAGNAYGWTMPCYTNCPTNPAEYPWYGMKGWTIDWDTTSPIPVVLIQDGVITSNPVVAQSAASTNTAYPGYGDNHGFDIEWLPKSLVKGYHTSCIRALNVGGGNDKTLGCFTYYTPGPPAAASNLVATPTGPTVTITFTDNANDETGFYLQRSMDAGASWLQVGGQIPPVLGSGTRGSVTDYSTVPAGTCYRILAVNAYGQSLSVPACTS